MDFNLNSSGFNAFNNFNPRVRRQKVGIGTLVALVVFGAAFTGIGFAVIRSSKIDPSWIRINGTVTGYTTSGSYSSSTYNNGSRTSNGPTYPAIVSYQVNGQTYTVTSSSSTSSRPVTGSSRQIAYNPQAPGDAKVVDKMTGILYIFPAIGIILLVLGPVLFIRSVRRSKDINQLQQTGQKIQGIISNIQNVGQHNNATSYKIEVTAVDPASGGTRQYVSDSLAGIGGLAMANYQTNPIPIDVFVNPANPNDYYVDVSEIPNLTPDRIKQLIGQAAANHPLNQTPASLTTPVSPTNSTIPPSQTPPANPVQ